MKKIFAATLSFMLAVYAIPIAALNLTEKEAPPVVQSRLSPPSTRPETPETPDTPDAEPTFDRKTQVSVLIGGSPQTMSLHDYLCGVVAAEMPAAFPIEALKAQAVAARSYALYKIKNEPDAHENAQLCDDFAHCAAFFDMEKGGKALWGENCDMYAEKIRAAVSETDGVVATYDGEIIEALFHSASSERTEDAVNVWGAEYPYLVSVESLGGSDYPNYYGTVAVESTVFAEKIKSLYKNADLSGSISRWIGKLERSSSGRVLFADIGGVSVRGTDLRALFGLNSTDFTVDVADGKIIFSTKGAGHGVGMSQYGARYLALSGAYFDEIVRHYYSGVELMLKN